MRVLRFDSVGGASGDMILGALIALGVDLNEVEDELRKLIPEPFSLRRDAKSSFGTSGSILTVDIPSNDVSHHHFCGRSHDDLSEHSCGRSHDDLSEHSCGRPHDDLSEHSCGRSHDVSHDHSPTSGHFHRSFADIRRMIEASPLDVAVKKNALDVFQALAIAEGEVHQVAPDDVRFHEVGATDSLIDIVGSAIAFHRLNLDGISVSPLPIGSGTVRCAHGIYPLPAPATAALLRNYRLPVSNDGEELEMLTPTGAALLAVWEKKEIPSGSVLVQSVHSFGHAEMKSRPNLLRASVYESSSSETPQNVVSTDGYLTESPILFECNIDDATGESLADATTALFDAGALDVWLTPILMKKSRPAQLLSVLASPDRRDDVLTAIFRHSGTFGVREQIVRRRSLQRRWENVETDFGTVRMKVGSRFGRDVAWSPEFDDCRQAARNFDVSVIQVMRETFAKWRRSLE